MSLSKYILLLLCVVTMSTIGADFENNGNALTPEPLLVVAGEKGGQYPDDVVCRTFIETLYFFTNSMIHTINNNINVSANYLNLAPGNRLEILGFAQTYYYKIHRLKDHTIKFCLQINKQDIIKETELTPQELNNILKKQSFWAYLKSRLNEYTRDKRS